MSGVNVLAANGMKTGCVDVRGQGTGKVDISRELEKWKVDIVGVTETQIRDDMRVEGEMSGMTG